MIIEWMEMEMRVIWGDESVVWEIWIWMDRRRLYEWMRVANECNGMKWKNECEIVYCGWNVYGITEDGMYMDMRWVMNG